MPRTKRIRDLRRRAKTNIRRIVSTKDVPEIPVTTMPFTRNAKGERVRVASVYEEARRA